MNKKVLLIVGITGGLLLLCICVVAAGLMMNAKNVVDAVSTVEAPVVGAATQMAEPTTAPVVENTPDPGAIAANTASAEEAADEFLTRLALEQYADAVAVTAIELRSDPATAGQLEQIVLEKGLRPGVWTWNSVQEDSAKGETYLGGLVQYFDNRRGYMTVELRMENGAWMVYYLDLKADENLNAVGPSTGWSADQKELEIAIAESSANLFLGDWQSGDLASAYEYSHSTLKDQVGSAEALAEVLNGTGLQLSGWAWDSYQIIEQGDGEMPVLSFTGTATFQESMTGPVEVQLRSTGSDWAVSYFDINTN